jgi:hypothetical protein
MKIFIPLNPHTFADFKQKVAQAFPAWEVTGPAPLVYVNDRGTEASIFTLTDRQFSAEEIEQLKAIAAQAEYQEPSQPARVWQPLERQSKAKAKRQMMAQINRFGLPGGRRLA